MTTKINLTNKNGATFELDGLTATLNGFPFVKKIRRSSNYSDQICINDGEHSYNFTIMTASQWDAINYYNENATITKTKCNRVKTAKNCNSLEEFVEYDYEASKIIKLRKLSLDEYTADIKHKIEMYQNDLNAMVDEWQKINALTDEEASDIINQKYAENQANAKKSAVMQVSKTDMADLLLALAEKSGIDLSALIK